MSEVATSRVSEAIARPVRGVGQGGVGWLLVECIEAFNVYDFNDKQYGLAVIVLGAVVSYIQNLVENKIGKGILRQVPPTTVPVIDNVDKPKDPADEVDPENVDPDEQGGDLPHIDHADPKEDDA